MPHEKIWDAHNTGTLPGDDRMPDQNALEIHWSNLTDARGAGYVRVTVDRPGVDARGAVDTTTAMNETMALLSAFEGDQGEGDDGSLVELLGTARLAKLAGRLAPRLAYSYGPPANRLGIALDRDGVNRLIRHAKRAGRTAFGADEW
jgi:hypothetical protein